MSYLGLDMSKLREKNDSNKLDEKRLFKPVKRVSIGFDKENIIEAAPRWKKAPPNNKLPSFEAFVEEIRQGDRHRRRF